MENDKIEIVEIEVGNQKTTPEQIKNFFENKQIECHKVTKSNKSLEKLLVYDVELISSNDLYSTLQHIKDEGIDLKEGISITYHSKTDYHKISSELLKKEKLKKIITFKECYQSICKIDYIKQIGEEGIEFIDQETIEKQRSVITYMIKKIGTNLLSGQSIMNTSLPIYIFEERSLLQSFIYKFKLSHDYLDAAADASNLERLKQVTTFIFTNLHLSCKMSKPFNPILGETFQCKIKDTMYYCEQTSHHPPVLNYYIKNSKYQCFGNENLIALTSTNKVTASFNGKYFIRFNDGVTITYTLPKFILSGVLMGKRLINFQGDLVVQDLFNGFMACIHINPTKSGFFSRLFSSKGTYPDFSTGFVCRTSDVTYDPESKSYKCDKKNVLSTIEGEWTNYLKFDDRYYWKHGETPNYELEKQYFTLPSDSLYREDIVLFREGNLEMAQQAKTNLEEIQRKDRKLRASHK